MSGKRPKRLIKQASKRDADVEQKLLGICTKGVSSTAKIQTSQYEAEEIAKLRRVIGYLMEILRNLDHQEKKIGRWAKRLQQQGGELRNFGDGMATTGTEILKQMERTDEKETGKFAEALSDLQTENPWEEPRPGQAPSEDIEGSVKNNLVL